MPSLHIPYSLSLLANTGRDPALGTIKRGFIAEYECVLDVDYTDTQDWEVVSVTFEQTRWNDEFVVSPLSDPDLWKLVVRAMDYDWKDLSDKVRECIIDDHAECGDDRGDWLHDQLQEYR